jgi:succinylglutamic semialdehyde dehydrogenase
MTNISSFEPATGEQLWTGTIGDPAEAVARARAAWPAWAAKPLAVRIETLRRFANGVRGKIDDFADLIARETGKPLWEARTEVEAVVNKVDISVSAYAERTSQRRLEGALGSKVAVRHKPHGVLAVLGPYNFPAHLPNGHIVPALIAGNAVVFKPSEKTPAVGEMLTRLIHEAGVPEDVAICVQGGAETGKGLAAQGGLDGLLFTGSARAGVALHRQFADTPQKILALEMGGNNPLVVWDVADVAAAATIAAQSAFLSAGQRCTAARRLIVRDGTEGAADRGDRTDHRPHHHRSSPRQSGAVHGAGDRQLRQPTACRRHSWSCSGGRAGDPAARPAAGEPAVPDPCPARRHRCGAAAGRELFGPVLQIVRVPDFESALAEANATRYGLAASLIGGSPELYDRFWANSRAGVINWNKPTNGAPSTAPVRRHRPQRQSPAERLLRRRTIAPIRSPVRKGKASAPRSGWA